MSTNNSHQISDRKMYLNEELAVGMMAVAEYNNVDGESSR
jgi:hypothetical protein